MYQLQRHFLMTLGAKQGVFAKAIEETLSKRFGRQHPVASGIIGHLGRYNIGKLFSHFLIAYIAVQTVITNSLKPLGQDMLYHSSDELEYGEGFMLHLSGFMFTVPVADRFAVISFDPSYRDKRRDNILCQALGQPLTTRGHFAFLEKSDKAHFFRIAAVEHLLNSFVVVGAVKAWSKLFKHLPVIVENLLKNVFVEAFHGGSFGITITELVE